MSQTTTTRNGFRVDDITFHSARRQSAVEEEIKAENPDEIYEDDIKAPVSLTPEQVKAYYMLKIAQSKDSNEKRVYAQSIKWIDELLDTKKKLFALEAKEAGKEVSEFDNGIEE